MKVNMNVVESRASVGYFKKVDVSEIKLDVQFTEEEKYNIKKLGLGDRLFFAIPVLAADTKSQEVMGPDGYPIYIRDLVKGKWPNLTYDSLHQANDALNKLEQQFRNLKSHIEDAQPESRTLDL